MNLNSTSPKLVHIVTSPMTAWAFLGGQLRYMRDNGFDVTLISSPGPELDKIAEREGVRVMAIPMRRQPSPVHDVVSLVRLTRLLWKLRPEIIHCGTPKASFLGGMAGYLAGVPVRVMTLHGMRADGLKGPMRSAVMAMERLSCAAVQRVYCVSGSLRWRALDLKLTPAEKLRVLAKGTANGIDAARFSRSDQVLKQADCLRQQLGLSSDRRVIGFVGRLVGDKGIGELVTAFKRLKVDDDRVTLLLVGPFEQYDGVSTELRRQISTDPQIIHLGYLDDPAPAYALMNVLALPSYREGFPYVPMEAAAMQLPVVATRVTGCVDAVVDGVTGTLVPSHDANELTRVLAAYLHDPQLCRQHGTAARNRVISDFEPESVWRDLHLEYMELLQKSCIPVQVLERDKPFETPITNLQLQESPID